VRYRRLAGEEHALGVDVHHEVPRLGGELGDRPERDHPGVGAHHVEPAEALQRRRHERLALGLLPHVDGDRLGAGALRFGRLAGLRPRLRHLGTIEEVADHRVGALGSERLDDAPADAP
jgi:hypothetical protein